MTPPQIGERAVEPGAQEPHAGDVRAGKVPTEGGGRRGRKVRSRGKLEFWQSKPLPLHSQVRVGAGRALIGEDKGGKRRICSERRQSGRVRFGKVLATQLQLIHPSADYWVQSHFLLFYTTDFTCLYIVLIFFYFTQTKVF